MGCDLSIAMTTYNGERHIAEQLRSFAEQTVLPGELVVTDDGSTDRTIEIIRNFAETAPFPVKIVINEKNLGFRDNFLKAASLCSGRYICFSDQDDFWLPMKNEKSLARLEADGTDLCIHTAIIGDEQLNEIGLLHQDIEHDRVINALHALPMPGRSYGFTMTFSRDLLQLVDPALRPPQPQENGKRVYHDLWVYLMAFAFGRISEIREPLAIYRQHRNMTSSGAQNAPPATREVPLEQYAFRADFAGQVAEMLEKASLALTGERRVQAQNGAVFCRRFEKLVRDRMEIYRRAPVGRVASFTRLALSGAYKPTDQGGIGPRSALKDFVLGVLFLGRVSDVATIREEPSTTTL